MEHLKKYVFIFLFEKYFFNLFNVEKKIINIIIIYYIH